MKFIGWAVFASASLLFISSSATAQVSGLSEPILYDYIYYTDASKTAVAGYQQGVCNGGGRSPVWAGVAPQISGTVTAHYEQVRVGRCLANGTTIYE